MENGGVIMKPQKPLKQYLEDLLKIYRFIEDHYEKNKSFPTLKECSKELNMSEEELRNLTRDQDNILCLVQQNETSLGFPLND